MFHVRCGCLARPRRVARGDGVHDSFVLDLHLAREVGPTRLVGTGDANRLGAELRPVVGADVPRDATTDEQIRQGVKNLALVSFLPMISDQLQSWWGSPRKQRLRKTPSRPIIWQLFARGLQSIPYGTLNRRPELRCRCRTGHEAFSNCGRALYGRDSMKIIRLEPGPFVLPMPTVLIGATVNNVPNFMPVAFIGIVNFKPVVVACGMSPPTTHPRGYALTVRSVSTFPGGSRGGNGLVRDPFRQTDGQEQGLRDVRRRT